MEWTIPAEASSQAQGPTLEEEVLSRLIQENCDQARARVLKELHTARPLDGARYAQVWQPDNALRTTGAAVLTNDKLVGMTQHQMHNEANSGDEGSSDGCGGTGSEGKALRSELNVSPADVLSSSRTAFVGVPHMNIAHERQSLQNALNDFHARVVQPERQTFQRAATQVERMVNAVLEHVGTLDGTFKCRKVNAETSFYECHSRSNVDFHVILENVPPGSFVLEDMKTPTGFARVRLASEMTSHMTSGSTSSTTLEVTAVVSDLAQYCTKTDSGEFYLSPKKLCKRFAALVDEASLDALGENFFSSHFKTVSLGSEESSSDAVVAYQVGLIPTIHCPDTWPSCARWLRSCSRKWPEASVKDHVIHGGIDLVAMPTAQDKDELWRISFSGARRRLIRSVHNESKEKCLQILNALYQEDLSRPEALSASHLENVVLWASKKYWSPAHWSEASLPDRFLEMLTALHKCLQNRDCYDFFVPALNLFALHKPRTLHVLAARVQDVLENPHKYLLTGSKLL